MVGDVVDLALRPDTWLLPFGSRLVLGSTDGISIKDANLEALNALEQSSIDFYIAIRSAYLMNREAMVSGSGDPSTESSEPFGDAIPETEAAPMEPAFGPVSAPPSESAPKEPPPLP